MGKVYIAWNAVPPTTAAQVSVSTGTAVKTLLQVATPASKSIKIIEWGISFNGSAAATPINVELLQTDVAATSGTSVTPTLYDDPLAEASLCVGGTGATCHSPSAEGTITAAKVFDGGFIAPTNGYAKQFPLGREPQIPISKFLRVRVTAPAAVNALCYIIWEE